MPEYDPYYPGQSGRQGRGRGRNDEELSKPGSAYGPGSGGPGGSWADQLGSNWQDKSGKGGLERYSDRIDTGLGRLDDWASGKNSVAMEQLKQALGQNVAREQSFAATGRGNQALQQRQASQNIGGLRSGLAGQGALAGLQERAMANQQLMQALMGLRGQEVQMKLPGAQADAMQPSTTDRLMGMGGGLLQGYMMSDERVKTNVADADKDADALLEGLKAYSYDYKNPKHGKGRQLAIMAQDLEKAGLPGAIIETPEGKAVDAAKLAGALAAATSSLHRRMKKLEG